MMLETAPSTVVNPVQFTMNQLESAFAKVRNPKDWRAEIDCTVTIDELAVTLLAIEFYTATKAVVWPCQIRDPQHADLAKYRVQSVGYRRGPAGDH